MIETIVQLIKDFFRSLKNLLEDFFLTIVDWVLSGVASVLESIDPPDFLTQYNMQSLIPDSVVWFLSVSGFGECLTIISAAYVFRIIRRFVTLGIW